jgi:hypothetical protein
MKYAIYCFQLLVTCTYVKVLLIHAICVVPQGSVFSEILSPNSYAPHHRAATSRIPLQHCMLYGRMFKIGFEPCISTDSPQPILRCISGRRQSHRTSLLLLLRSWFLSPFLFPTIMSLNRYNPHSCWIVYLAQYSQGYRQSLMWRVAWHYICAIW